MIKKVQPGTKLSGTVTAPPDKSISHRSALFAALSREVSVIENFSEAADPQSTLNCLTLLGVEIDRNGRSVRIRGVGRDGFQTPLKPLDCGNSGTTMRLLSGIVAGAGIECRLTGDASLSSRTMKRIMDPLKQMGCTIDGKDGEYAPIHIGKNQGLRPLRYPLPIPSAQLKSCVLLAGLFSDDPVEVVEPIPSRDHTERLLELDSEAFGTAKVIRSSRSDVIPAQNYEVPGDFSAAAFWMVGGTIFPGAEIRISNTGMNPTRNAAYHILEQMGAEFERTNDRFAQKEPVSDLTVTSSALRAIELDPALVPNCIDELPVLMVAMCFAEGRSVISGASELRHKETDRLAAMHEILTLAGAKTELKEDGIIIYGNPDFEPLAARYPSFHDHRMAMASAILALRSKGSSEIVDAECTAISYPHFWQDLSALQEN
ncbi:3-phosphoshikimate 1-carboxyvinyltransferase [Rhodohalobacter mucosus]|uniref:3-phosphoshikimate 1-carboxyvinyltransferase n=1 Tax=Rhodohalobacter mucosus TaxID=2079485 RepID=A0A316U3S6_9BACT|nr:3-phosphoshikimate 1-carboxyvinyltransferase [Rhodohalobacter mucosus]PWN08146.1 3-phosphoshikimate 1-carboxyvinyltransferase [Rhodohalobacter mucosus]